MNDETINDLFRYPTLTLAILSIFGNIYVAFVIFRLKRRLEQEYGFISLITHDYIIYHLILTMSIMDSFTVVANTAASCITWTHPTLGCYISAFADQFFSVFCSLWRLLLPSYLLYLLINTNVSKQRVNSSVDPQKQIYKSRILFYTIVCTFIVLSFVASVIPLDWDNSTYYGIYYYPYNGKDDTYGATCLVLDYFLLVDFCIWGVLVLFNIIVLMFTIYKYNKTKWYTKAYLVLIKRLLIWIFLFEIIYTIPVIDATIYYLIDRHDYEHHLWLILFNKNIYVLQGIANAIALSLSQKIQPPAINEQSLIKNNNEYEPQRGQVQINTSGQSETTEVEITQTLTDTNNNSKYTDYDTNTHSTQASNWNTYDTNVSDKYRGNLYQANTVYGHN